MFDSLTWIDLGVIVSAAAATTAIVNKFTTPAPVAIPTVSDAKPLSFDFSLDGTLTCANVEAAEFLSGLKLSNSDWPTLQKTLSARFAGLPIALTTQEEPVTITIPARTLSDPMILLLEHHANGLTLLMKRRDNIGETNLAGIHTELSSLENLTLVKAASENAPFPVWQTNTDGSTGWSNAYYKTLDQRFSLEDGPLFDVPSTHDTSDRPIRMTLKDNSNNRTHWFDLTRQRFEDGFLNFAIDVHAVVNAETAQRNFVQTLAKTFAHLATGLAIFDRNRQLVLFNPALFDLTELRPEFLTTRPNLFSFFDKLRDNQIMPEPKNYANWREQIADVISAASDDNFSETWHLPNGLTYRITGRPHPDGAIAFLFEDISAEISLTRRFRSEADVTRSALDSLEQAIAIFNQAGILQHCNTAMSQFIGQHTETDLENMTVRDMTHLCQRGFKPSPAWGDVRDFVTECTEREAWSADLVKKDGQCMELKVSPLASGASLVTFAHTLQGIVAKRRPIMTKKRITQAKSAVA